MNFVDSLQHEIQRNKELLQSYQEIGPAGAFSAAVIEIKIREAEESLLHGEFVRMLRCYKMLQESE